MPSFSLFCKLVNREIMWAISEVVSEPYELDQFTFVMSFERYVRVGGPISCVRSCGSYISTLTRWATWRGLW